MTSITKTEIMPGIFVRRATRQDVPDIVRMLADDMFGSQREKYQDPLQGSYYDAFEQIENDAYAELIVIEAENEIIGTLQLDFINGLSFQGRQLAQIEAVRVDGRHRNKGIGCALLQWAIEYARAKKCYLVQLASNNQRLDAQRFYLDLGFVASHVGMKLYLDGGKH
jgi:ribosomal protein S18 acetylase RimI-like enzyme